MALIHRLLEEIDDDERQAGERQCFISHRFGEDDLREKLERALAQLELHAYFADKEVTGEYILNKVCKKILLTRASIVDLTYANPNVYFELGVAIGLNKPVFIVRKGDTAVPPLLESFIKLRFTSYNALERDLIALAPGWLKESIEHHLSLNNHCHFVNVLCLDRQRLTPRRRYLVIDQLRQSAGASDGDPDLRAELQAALGGFQYAPAFLEDITPSGGFGLCDYCRALRDSSFALCHLTSGSSTDVYLMLGLFTGLGIPGLLIVRRERDEGGEPRFKIPSMLQGVDAFHYERYKEIPARLAEEIDGFLKRHKNRPLAARRLIFPGLARREPEGERPEQRNMKESIDHTPDLIKEHPATGELNAFRVGSPVAHPRHFFGRERELRRLFYLWQRPPLQNAAIIGPRRAGKTSLLLYLKNITTTSPEQMRPDQRADWLPALERYRWILVDFQDPRMGRREGLLRHLLAGLELPAPDPCDLEHFFEVVSRGLQTPTIVLLDEVGVAFERYPELDNSFWEGLRALANTQVSGNLGFVMTAHKPPNALSNDHGYGSPFFNIFGYTTTLGSLAEAEARALIADSPIRFPTADVDWILAESGRWPILLNILCRERLLALQAGETGDDWREEGLQQITPFRYLLG